MRLKDLRTGTGGSVTATDDRKMRWGGLLFVLGIFALRLICLHHSFDSPRFFYSDSASHVLNGYWHTVGPLRTHWRFFPLAGMLFGGLTAMGVNIVYAPWVVNGILAVGVVFFLYDGVRRLADAFAAVLSSLLAISIPAFSRLVFSGQPEMTSYFFLMCGFWFSLRSLSEEGPRQFIREMAAVASLGLAVFGRQEMAGVFLAYGVVVFFRWRHQIPALFTLVCWMLFWLLVRLPSVLQKAVNDLVHLPTWSDFWSFPLWFFRDFFPMDVPVLLGFFGWSRKYLRGFPSVLFTLMVVQMALLWGTSYFCSFCGETERIFCGVLFLMMVPTGIFVAEVIQRQAPWKAKSLIVAFGVILIVSWGRPMPQEVKVDVNEISRETGRVLGRIFFTDTSGNKTGVLVEALDTTWPSLFVFSGVPDRLWLLNAVPDDWASKKTWDGRKPVGWVVGSGSIESTLRGKLGMLELIKTVGPYRIYRVTKSGEKTFPPPTIYKKIVTDRPWFTVHTDSLPVSCG